MATLTPTTPPLVTKSSTQSTNAGQAVGYVAASGGGDMVPLTGQAILLSFRTAGTGSTVTLNSIVPSNYGADQDITLVLAATDEQHILIKNDGRFDQGGGNAGLMAITYSSVTTLTVRATVIPGI